MKIKNWAYLMAALLCVGWYSCSKEKPVEQEEEVTPFDYSHLWYGIWLVEESSGKLQEGLFDIGDTFNGEVNICYNKTQPSTCYLAKQSGPVSTIITFELDFEKNILSNISLRIVDFEGDTFGPDNITMKSIPGSFTITRLDENNMHLKMVYSGGAEWIVKMRKTA